MQKNNPIDYIVAKAICIKTYFRPGSIIIVDEFPIPYMVLRISNLYLVTVDIYGDTHIIDDKVRSVDFADMSAKTFKRELISNIAEYLLTFPPEKLFRIYETAYFQSWFRSTPMRDSANELVAHLQRLRTNPQSYTSHVHEMIKMKEFINSC